MTTKTLKALLDSLDDLDPALAEHYVPGTGDLEGRYVLSVDDSDGYGVANAGKLHSALEGERKAKAKAERIAKQVEKDLAAAREQLASLEEQMTAGSPDAASVEKTIRAKLEAQFKSQLDAARAQAEERVGGLSSERDGYLAQIRELMVDSVIGAGETSKHSFRAKLLAPHLRSRVQIERDEETGQMVRRFLDGKGQPGFRGDGQPWDLDDVLHEVSRTDPDFAALITAKTGQPGRTPAAPGRSSNSHQAGPLRFSLEEVRSDPIRVSKLAEEARSAGRQVEFPDAMGGA